MTRSWGDGLAEQAGNALAPAGAKEGPVGPGSIRVGLVSADLMVASRLASLARGLGFIMQTVSAGAGISKLDLLLVDLNHDPEGQVAFMAGLLADHPGMATVCFGPHLGLAQLKPRVKAAGAQRCVANSALLPAVAKAVAGLSQLPTPPLGGRA